MSLLSLWFQRCGINRNARLFSRTRGRCGPRFFFFLLAFQPNCSFPFRRDWVSPLGRRSVASKLDTSSHLLFNFPCFCRGSTIFIRSLWWLTRAFDLITLSQIIGCAWLCRFLQETFEKRTFLCRLLSVCLSLEWWLLAFLSGNKIGNYHALRRVNFIFRWRDATSIDWLFSFTNSRTVAFVWEGQKEQTVALRSVTLTTRVVRSRHEM